MICLRWGVVILLLIISISDSISSGDTTSDYSRRHAEIFGVEFFSILDFATEDFTGINNVICAEEAYPIDLTDTPMIPDTSICVGSDVTIDFPIGEDLSLIETVLFEDFEDDEILYSVSITEFTDGAQDYFIRTDGSDISGESFSNLQGTSYFAAQDIDGEGAGPNQFLSFPNINISGLTNLDFSIFIAEDDNGSSENWDAPDFVHITYSIDSGPTQNLIWIENDGSSINSAPFIDDDFNGTGDSVEITSTFTQFFAALAGTGNLLTLTIEMFLDDGGTDIAFDNIQLLGDRVGSGCTYNVYDSDPASGASMLLADSVTAYTINSVSSDTTFYVTKIEDGCESPADKVLVLALDISVSIIDSLICLGDMIQFNGQLISTAGTFRDTLPNASMCDSIITLNVTVEPMPELTMITDTLCVNEADGVDLTQYEPEITMSAGTFNYSEREIIRSADLFISEYVEGSGDNKCIELYNNTGSTVDLSTYAINFYFNGSASISRSLNLLGQLLADDIYVICDEGIDPALSIVADTLFGGSFYNGDDAIALSNNGVEIDVIGQIGTDPGTQWGSGLTSTQNNTLVRNPDVIEGDANGSDAFDPSMEWIGFAENTVNDVGMHAINPVIIVTALSSPIVSVTDGDQFIVEFTDQATGCVSSTTITFELRDTSTTIVDVTVCQGDTFDFNGQAVSVSGTFFDTLTNAALCDSFITLTLTVIEPIEMMLDTTICDGEFVEFDGVMLNEPGIFKDTLESGQGCDSIVILDLAVVNSSNTEMDTTICMGESIIFGEQMIDMSGTFMDTLINSNTCDSIITLNVTVEPMPELTMINDTLCVNEADGVDLTQYESEITMSPGTINYSEREIIRSADIFISEYVEGSGDNKCIELYNNTGVDVDISTYAIEIVRPDAGDLRIDLMGIVPAGSTFVLCDNGTDIFDEADQIDNNLGYNGDDAIVLLNGADTVDVIGQVNVDPGGQWGSGLTSTQNNTLVRNPTIMEGDPVGSDGFDPSVEWIGFEVDFADDLGMHLIEPAVMVTALNSAVVSVDMGDVFIVEFTDSLTGCINFTTIIFEIEQCIFDLALVKVLSPGQSSTVSPGDLVSFDITIFNQGEVTAYDIMVQDYVPTGMIYDPVLNDAPWGNDAIYNAIDVLPAGSDTTITIQLTVAENPTAATLVNSAEIIFASATQGGPLATDEDDDLSNTGGNQESDNDIDDVMDNIDDQDDFDFAALSLCSDIRFTTPSVEDIAICDPTFDGVVTIVPTATQLPANLLFSEYIEGPTGANNKCLEIFNGTGAPVNLAGYAVNLYNTAPRLEPDRTLNLTGVIADGDVLVLCNNASFTDEVDIVDNDVINYNGDDIVTLTFNDVIIDAIGQIGIDPGTQWRSGGVSTLDQTLRRLPTIIAGDNDGFDVFLPDQEWISLGDDINDASDIGQHSITSPALNSFTFFDDDPASGGLPIATQVASLEVEVNLESSPIEVWVTTHPASSTCMSEAIRVRVAVRGEEATLTCIGSVNVSVEADCSIEDLPVTALYLGAIDPLFLQVYYRTEDGRSIDPTDVSQYQGEQLIYEVVDTCTNSTCWGLVNLDFKQIPQPTVIPTDTICCSEDVTQYIDLTLEEVVESINGSCYASLSNPTMVTMDSSVLCDTSIYTISYFADFSRENRKENQLLYQQSIVVVPIHIDSVISPGSHTRLDSVALVDTIIINECADFIASPLNVAKYWAEIIDPNDQNNNGFQEGIPFAYPHMVKGIRNIQDAVLEFIDIEIIHEDSLVMINDSVWARVDVIEKFVDTVLTITEREVVDFQLFSEGGTCNISTKFTDITSDGCFDDAEILRSWTIIDWCSKAVRETEQWIIFEDVSPPDFGVFPLDIQVLGTDMAIVNGTDTIPLSQVGDLVNTDELMATIFVEGAFECVADLDMPQFSNLSDNCTAIDDLEFSFSISDPNAFIADDGSEILNISSGVHELFITATDQCGNSASHMMTIVVIDRARPIAMCQERIHLSYAQSQENSFTALSLDVIDGGSFDACGDIILRLGQRLDNKVFCEGRFLQFIGTEFIEFCCEDVGQIIPIQLTVFDEFGNTSVCVTEVLVEDKFVPEATCFELDMGCSVPIIEDLTSAIDIDASDCFSPEVEFGEIMGPDECGSNSEQVDVFLDGVLQCAIQVNYNPVDQFDPKSIKWPAHKDGSQRTAVVRQCIDNEIFISSKVVEVVLDELLVCNGGYDIIQPSWCQVSCNLVGLSHEITSFGSQDQCRTDIIDWTIIDWCSYVPSQESSSDDGLELMDDRLLDSLNPEYIGTWLPSPSDGDTCARCNSYSSLTASPYFRYRDVEIDGHYTYQQIIKIVDNADPVITVSSVDTIYRSPANSEASKPCQFTGVITAQASDFCRDDILAENGVLSWHVILNGYIRLIHGPVSVDTLMGTGIDFEVLLTSEFDRYDLLWSVSDECQNSASAQSSVYFQDHAVSAPICLWAISLGSIDQSGITLHAEDLVISDLMDCDELAILGLSLDGDDQDIVDMLHLSCDELGMSDSLNLRLWSVDRFNNRNFCQVTLRYRVSNDCVDSSITLGGTVSTIFGEEMSNVEVALYDTNQQVLSSELTDSQGRYLLDSMIEQSAYLQAAYDNASLQGISTLDIILLQQYVLGLIDINNPYLLWAGDINRDGRISALDITLLRSALLGIGEDHGVGDWFFFDADQFVSPSMPIGDNSDIIEIADLSLTDETLDLLGMKYGDLSGDGYLAEQRAHLGNVVVEYATKHKVLNKHRTLELQIYHDEGISGFDIRLDINVIGDITINSDEASIRSTDYIVDNDGGIRLIWINSARSTLESISLSIIVEIEDDRLLDLEMVSGNLWSDTLQKYNMLLGGKDQSDLPTVSVYPNPFVHIAKLRISGVSGDHMDLIIYDGMGRLIKKHDDLYITDQTLFTIDAESLTGSGLYYYVLEGITSSISGRFIVL